MAEHGCTRLPERTAAAVVMEDAQTPAERPGFRRKTLLAFTKKLLESV